MEVPEIIGAVAGAYLGWVNGRENLRFLGAVNPRYERRGAQRRRLEGNSFDWSAPYGVYRPGQWMYNAMNPNPPTPPNSPVVGTVDSLPTQIVETQLPEIWPIMKTASRRYRKRRGTRKVSTKRRRGVKRTTKYRKKYNKKARRYRRKFSRRSSGNSGSKTNRAIYKYENGGVIGDSNCVYVGHGVPVNRVWYTYFWTVIRALYHEYGVDFTDFGEINPKNFVAGLHYVELDWSFGTSDTTTWKVARHQILATDTFAAIANTLADNFRTAYQAEVTGVGGENFVPMMHRIQLYEGLIGAPELRLASVNLKSTKIHLSFKSSLRVQNRTKNVDAATTNDVNNTNPLECKLYYGKYGKNFLAESSRVDAVYPPTLVIPGPPAIPVITYRGMTPESSTGLIKQVAANHPDTVWKEPPPAKVVGAYKAKNFYLQPGQVVVDNWKWKRSYSMDSFMSIFKDCITNQSTGTMNAGYCRVFGMEKLIADRSETGIVIAGYEVNSTCTVSFTSQCVTPSPFTEVA